MLSGHPDELKQCHINLNREFSFIIQRKFKDKFGIMRKVLLNLESN
jgi:hypothetical protein